MKKLVSAIQLLFISLSLVLTACAPTSDVPQPPSPEPTEYHVAEVKKMWGSDKFNAEEYTLNTKFVEENVEPLKFELNDGRRITLKYQETNNGSRKYKFSIGKFLIEYSAFVDTGNLSYLKVSGGDESDFDYKALLRDCKSDADAIEAVSAFAAVIGVLDIDSYECETDTLYRGGGNDEFFGFTHEGKDWTYSAFYFKKPYTIGEVEFNKSVFVDICSDSFTVSVKRELIDTATTKVSIAEIKSAVDSFVRDNFDPQFPVTDVKIKDQMLSFIWNDGRLCCTINEFFVDFTSIKDGTSYDDHIHCGVIVFLE